MREPIKPWPGPVYQQVPIALGRQNAIEYIAAINNDLRGLARLHGLDTLAYLLDMAQLEADLLTNGARAGCEKVGTGFSRQSRSK